MNQVETTLASNIVSGQFIFFSVFGVQGELVFRAFGTGCKRTFSGLPVPKF